MKKTKTEKNDVIVLLPAYNEEEAIADVIDEIMAVQIPARIVVVDSFSTDDTISIALHKGVEVVAADRGKGKAVRFALKHLSAKYIIMLDSDKTYPAKYIRPILKQLNNGSDAVLGTRWASEAGAMPKLNAFGNWFVTTLANLLYGTHIKDLCTGMWGFKGHVIDTIKYDLVSDGFTLEADMFVNLVRKKYKITEVPIEYRRRAGKAKLRWLDSLKIEWFLIKNKFLTK